MKKATYKEFKKMVTGKSIIPKRIFIYSFEFPRSRRVLELCFSHNIKAVHYYSKKNNSTLIFLADIGVFDTVNIFGMKNDISGYILKLHGNVDIVKFIRSGNKNLNKLLEKMYMEEEYSSRFEDEETKEEPEENQFSNIGNIFGDIFDEFLNKNKEKEAC